MSAVFPIPPTVFPIPAPPELGVGLGADWGDSMSDWARLAPSDDNPWAIKARADTSPLHLYIYPSPDLRYSQVIDLPFFGLAYDQTSDEYKLGWQDDPSLSPDFPVPTFQSSGKTWTLVHVWIFANNTPGGYVREVRVDVVDEDGERQNYGLKSDGTTVPGENYSVLFGTGSPDPPAPLVNKPVS